MSQLPEQVSEQEIEEMFQFADRDADGQISWEEFLLMITPVKLAEAERPKLVKPPVRLEGVRAAQSSEEERELCDNKEDRSGYGDNLEMAIRTPTEQNEAVNINSHQNMEDSETAETRADETGVYEVGTKEGSSEEEG